MKRIFFHFCLTLVVLICTCFNCNALEFKAGQYYFDNSKLHFSTVKMVVGNDNYTIVCEMLPDSINTNWFQVSLNNDITNLDGFCFIDSEIAPNTYNSGLDDFLCEAVNNEPNFRQTKIRNSIGCEPDRLIGWVFCPLNDATQSDGYWRIKESYDVTISGTLPTVYINTENSQTISSKDYYINGNIWIDNCAPFGFGNMSSEQTPLEMQIKGRGNYTWNASYKKPYKLRLSRKESPLGLDNSKHFILKPDFMDWSGYLRNETGFEISRLLGMPYTANQFPVELVLNGEYQGLYFLCENIRVESGRVDIVEQQENDNNPYNVTGGWLLELGYKENQVIAQFENNDPANNWFAFMSNSPEVLSAVQLNYIHDFINRADSCIFVTNKTDTGWEQYFDIYSLARFYVIHEVMENVEAFSGSLFMYKDWGEEEKLHFGPVWDFDNSGLNTTGDNFIYNYNSIFSFLWIRELKKFPRFQQVIRQIWKVFKDNDILNKINEHAALWRSMIVAAENCDKVRWRTYASIHPEEYVTDYLNLISRKVEWLNEQWSVPEGDVNCDGVVTAYDVTCIYNYLLNGDDFYQITCDVDGNGEITAHDITTLYNILFR